MREDVPAGPAAWHEDLHSLARRVGRRVIGFSRHQPIHLGAALSAAHILTALYFGFLRVRPEEPEWPGRDRFVLSKGHAAYALYAVLCERGFLPVDLSSPAALPGHPGDEVRGVDVATGALGHGLSIGCGMALACRFTTSRFRVVVLLGDGELNEGSNWEAAMFAAHQRLPNLIAVVDRNRVQQEGATASILDTEPLAAKWAAFGWQTVAVDGHDPDQVSSALHRCAASGRGPSVILAETVKGKGVSFMENDPAWHMGQVRGELFERAVDELSQPPGTAE
jgi:transketolase